ncbi:ABC transporter substrate-binding protein [Thermodesulfobacteriota bacterium]
MRKRIILVGVCIAVVCLFGVNNGQAEKRVITIGHFPFGPAQWVAQYMVDQGIYKKYGDKIGVEYKVLFPGDDFAAFMGRSVNVGTFASVEVARLLADEGKHIVLFGKYCTAMNGIYVKADSGYQSIVDVKGKRLGIPGWDTGTAQQAQVLFKEFHNIDMKKDFKVVVSSWPLLPNLLAKGDLEMALNIVPITMNLLMQGKIKPMLHTFATEWAKYNEGHFLGLTFLCMWKDFLDKNEDVAKNLLAAYEEGLYYSYANTEEFVRKYIPLFDKDATEENVKYFTKFYMKYKYLYQDPYIDEEFIQGELNFLRSAAKAGILKEKDVNRAIFRIIK